MTSPNIHLVNHNLSVLYSIQCDSSVLQVSVCVHELTAASAGCRLNKDASLRRFTGRDPEFAWVRERSDPVTRTKLRKVDAFCGLWIV